MSVGAASSGSRQKVGYKGRVEAKVGHSCLAFDKAKAQGINMQS